jgi:acyl-CoA synthetase (AMP-forming)/AMP-acid ligase II
MAWDVRPRDPSMRQETFGMSEVCGALTYCTDEDMPEHQRSANGRVLPGFEVKLVDPDTGKECGLNESGELWIRGPFLFEGYYGRHRSQTFDQNGWWHSGDVVQLDADGFLYMKGRTGDMIKTAGANVSPREVEAVLSDLAGGLISIVVGVPDKDRGQIVAGVLITDSSIDEAGLKTQLAEKLSSYKVPRKIVAMKQAEIPALSSGKVDMRKLATLVKDRA